MKIKFIFISALLVAYLGGRCHIQTFDLDKNPYVYVVQCKREVSNYKPIPGLIMPWEEVIL